MKKKKRKNNEGSWGKKTIRCRQALSMDMNEQLTYGLGILNPMTYGINS